MDNLEYYGVDAIPFYHHIGGRRFGFVVIPAWDYGCGFEARHEYSGWKAAWFPESNAIGPTRRVLAAQDTLDARYEQFGEEFLAALIAADSTPAVVGEWH